MGMICGQEPRPRPQVSNPIEIKLCSHNVRDIFSDHRNLASAVPARFTHCVRDHAFTKKRAEPKPWPTCVNDIARHICGVYA